MPALASREGGLQGAGDLLRLRRRRVAKLVAGGGHDAARLGGRLTVGRLAGQRCRLRVGRYRQQNGHQGDGQRHGDEVPVPAEREGLGGFVAGRGPDGVSAQPGLHDAGGVSVEKGAG